MRVLVTAGPTREYIDTVRFISNASTGRMGHAVAAAAVRSRHDVTLLTGAAALPPPVGCAVVPFVSTDDLKGAMAKRFDACDGLVMAAAVGDFRPEEVRRSKMSRRDGPRVIRLVPTEDILAGVARRKRPDQIIVAFAVEDGTRQAMEAAARRKMVDKGADFVVVNAPGAMAAEKSEACILSERGLVLPWADRTKEALGEEIVRLLEEARSRLRE